MRNHCGLVVLNTNAQYTYRYAYMMRCTLRVMHTECANAFVAMHTGRVNTRVVMRVAG